MLRIFMAMIFAVVSFTLAAQDSLHQTTPDSTTTSFKNIQHYAQLPTGGVKNYSDSLSPSVKKYKHSLDSSENHLKHKIDSLDKLHLPTTRLTHQLDSIRRIDYLKDARNQEAKLMNEEKKLTGAVSATENKLTKEIGSVEQAGKSIPGLSTPNLNLPSGTNLPGASLPNTALPQLQVPNTSLPNTSLPTTSLPSTSLPNVSNPLNTGALSNDLQKDLNIAPLEKELGQAGQIAQKSEGLGKEVSGLTKGDATSTAALEKKAEGELTGMNGFKQLQTENQQIAEAKKLATSAENPETMEKQELATLQKQAINHFAGKEQELQAAMNKVSSLKRKYSSLNSLSEIPFKSKNPMHGKPLIERLVPGISMQVLKTNNHLMIDFNPWIGYKLNGHITAGAGWNERTGFRHHQLLRHSDAYGPRVFGEYLVRSGFSLRAEAEVMNARIPPAQVTAFDSHHRQNVFGTFAGIKKDYRLFKHLKGNVQMLYNLNSLYDKHHFNIYGDPLTARIGFTFPMTKKSRKVPVKVP